MRGEGSMVGAENCLKILCIPSSPGTWNSGQTMRWNLVYHTSEQLSYERNLPYNLVHKPGADSSLTVGIEACFCLWLCLWGMVIENGRQVDLPNMLTTDDVEIYNAFTCQLCIPTQEPWCSGGLMIQRSILEHPLYTSVCSYLWKKSKKAFFLFSRSGIVVLVGPIRDQGFTV